MASESTTLTIALPHRVTPSQWWLGCVLAAIAYYLTAQLGLLIATIGATITIIWLPTGIATGMFYRYGIRYWPGIFIAAVAVNHTTLRTHTAFLIAIGNTLAPIICAMLLRRMKFQSSFATWRDIAVLAVAALSSMAISAVNGSVWLIVSGVISITIWQEAVTVWWLGDAGGVLIAAPTILAWTPDMLERMRRRGNFIQFLAASSLTVGICVFLYLEVFALAAWSLTLIFLPFICVLRVATVYRAWGVALQILIVAVFAVWANHRGTGISQHFDSHTRPYFLWGYLVSMSLIAMALVGLLSERDQIAKRLRDSEGEYRRLVDDNPAIICRFRDDGTILFANETYRRIFGAGRVTGKENLINRAGLLSDRAALDRLPSLIPTDAPVDLECFAKDVASKGRWVRWSIRAAESSANGQPEYLAIGLDVTERKRAEVERKELEIQAIQAQQFEAVGVLAGGVAHEFNNILTGILGNAELVQMMLPKNSDAHSCVGEIRTGANRAAELTRQLMIFAGKSNAAVGPLPLTAFIRDNDGLFAIAISKRCRILYHLDDELPLIRADEASIRQVLMSLVTNAGEAIAKQSGTIQIRTLARNVTDIPLSSEWVKSPGMQLIGDYVQLEVIDDGFGMSPDIQARIFEPFFTTKFPGRGLGMAAVLGIVRGHNGAIRVRSLPGSGTTISLLFPVATTYVEGSSVIGMQTISRQVVRG